ncbi:MAG: class I SAM-dependent methyltransferase [Cryomorphaceae bacterium]|nr:class I SAM-dependent methyltransferase [Cryomorphaceae bacterium]
MVRCDSCAHLYTKDAPNEDEIGSYYDSETYISHTDTKETLFDRVYAMVKQYMLSRKWGWIRAHVPRGTIVDYGAGSGAFVHFLNQLGREAHGYEIAEAGRKTAKEKYNVMLYEPSDLNALENNSVACFTMWHVLEHIYTPKTLIETCRDKLKKDGILVVAVPNPESWDAKHYKEHWAAWDVPIHVSHFQSKVIIPFVEKTGFTLVDKRGMPFDAFYVSLISNENKFKNKKPIKAFFNGLKSNLSAGKEKNHSSLVYIFKKA